MREQFPIFKTHPDLIYLDSAATTQKPQCVIDAMSHFYSSSYATVHRAVYSLCKEATTAYETVREQVAQFVNAKSAQEIIFTRGTTSGINLIAHSFPLQKGDAVLISQTEHHSNIVPWQLLAEKKGIELRVVSTNSKGEIDLVEFKHLLDQNVKLVSLAHISNALGVVHPIKEMISLAHAVGARFLVDGAQAAAHGPIDVRDLDADFYLFSGHKVYGPTGIGVLYGKSELLEQMPPFEGGGDMIEKVSFKKTTYNTPPLKFEAGTPSVAEVVGLGAALKFLKGIGMPFIGEIEKKLIGYAIEKLGALEDISLLGPLNTEGAILSFTVKKAHPLDIATMLDCRQMAVRSGHHCAQPTMDLLGVSGTVRVSFGLYNTKEEIDRLSCALKEILPFLS